MTPLARRVAAVFAVALAAACSQPSNSGSASPTGPTVTAADIAALAPTAKDVPKSWGRFKGAPPEPETGQALEGGMSGLQVTLQSKDGGLVHWTGTVFASEDQAKAIFDAFRQVTPDQAQMAFQQLADPGLGDESVGKLAPNISQYAYEWRTGNAVFTLNVQSDRLTSDEKAAAAAKAFAGESG